MSRAPLASESTVFVVAAFFQLAGTGMQIEVRLMWTSLTTQLAAPARPMLMLMLQLPDPEIDRRLFASIALDLIVNGLSLVK